MRELHRGTRLCKKLDELYLSRLADAIKHDPIMLCTWRLLCFIFIKAASLRQHINNQYYPIFPTNKNNTAALLQGWFVSSDLNKNNSVFS